MNVERYRKRLLEERQHVVDAIEYLHEENPAASEDEQESALDNHLAEAASLTLEREIDYSLEENSTAVLHAIDAALARIDAGQFGTCERCGKTIPEERLEALPYATLCIDCKRQSERG